MAETFGISEKTGDGVSVVAATGEIDIATAPSLRQQLEASIDRGPAVVVVDLLGVTFMDSTALGVLVGAGALRIVVSDTRVLKVFEITGLTEVFPIFPTVDDRSAVDRRHPGVLPDGSPVCDRSSRFRPAPTCWYLPASPPRRWRPAPDACVAAAGR